MIGYRFLSLREKPAPGHPAAGWLWSGNRRVPDARAGQGDRHQNNGSNPVIAYRFQNLDEHPHHGVLLHRDEARTALFLTPKEAKATVRLTIARIQLVVSEYYGIAEEHMRSRSHDRNHVQPRWMAMLLVRELLPQHGFMEIGRRFGNKHHTTIIHGLRSISKLIAEQPATQAEYLTLRGKLAA